MKIGSGPKTMELAKDFASDDLSGLKRYRFRVRQIGPMQITIYRSGYTGEDGLEVVVPSALANVLTPKLVGLMLFLALYLALLAASIGWMRARPPMEAGAYSARCFVLAGAVTCGFFFLSTPTGRGRTARRAAAWS